MQEQEQDRVVLDTSVIAAIFFKEEASDRAGRAVGDYGLVTLDLAIAEVANVAWKRVFYFDESKDIMLKALRKCVDFITGVCEVVSSRGLFEDAFEVGVKNNITVYDSLFVAAAQREDVPLLTLDRGLYEKLRKTSSVRVL